MMGRDAHIRTMLLPLLAIATAVMILLVWGWQTGLLGADAAQTIYLLILTGLTNVLLLGTFLFLHERFREKQRLIELYRRELDYFLAVASEEGVLRKQGLLRSLHNLGASPNALEKAALPGANLAGLNLQNCNLKGANLRGANLRGCTLASADLFGVDLHGADLSMANLRGANLRGADLSSACLVKAELEHANLHRANLVDANLDGVSLDSVRLHKARFAGREPDVLDQTLHPSVEDWIRERLDERGYFCPEQTPDSKKSRHS